MDGLPGFVLAGVALAGSPGPATLSLAATGAAFGARNGLAYLCGIIIGMAGVMALTASGAVGLLLALPGAAPAMTALAAAYFAVLAYRIATAPPVPKRTGTQRRPSFAGGAVLSLVNPKGYVAMAALFSGFVLVRERVALDAAAKALVLTAIIVAVNLAWLWAGTALTRVFQDPRANRAVNMAFAALLLASVAIALLA